MEDTGLVGPLVADHVGAPAEEGPEVHVRVRSVVDHTEAGAGGVAGGWEEAGGQRVVEGPGERVGRREAPEAAGDPDGLVLGHAVDDVLALVTHGGVCTHGLYCQTSSCESNSRNPLLHFSTFATLGHFGLSGLFSDLMEFRNRKIIW